MMKTAFFISAAILALSVVPFAGAAQDQASDQGPLIVEVQPTAP
jgi:hypothetical protein